MWFFRFYDAARTLNFPRYFLRNNTASRHNTSRSLRDFDLSVFHRLRLRLSHVDRAATNNSTTRRTGR